MKIKEKMNKVTGKIKETVIETKDFVVENKGLCVAAGASVLGAGLIVFGIRKNNKALETAWRAANEAVKRNDRNFDYGPYKIMRALDPNTLEVIGDIACHERTLEVFMNLK